MPPPPRAEYLLAATAHSRVLSRTVLPLLVMSQTVPTIAIAPILVIWFGPGEAARLIVVFMIAFFPIVVNTTAGLLRVNEELIDLVRGLNASRWKIFTKIRLPNALPHIFTGMRISIALSVIGSVVGEFVAATEGLGYLIFSANTNLDTKLAFAAVVLLAAMGIVLFQIVRLAQRLLVPRRRIRASPARDAVAALRLSIVSDDYDRIQALKERRRRHRGRRRARLRHPRSRLDLPAPVPQPRIRHRRNVVQHLHAGAVAGRFSLSRHSGVSVARLSARLDLCADRSRHSRAGRFAGGAWSACRAITSRAASRCAACCKTNTASHPAK